LQGAIEATRQQSFVTALLQRADTKQTERIQSMADLLAQHGRDSGAKPAIAGDANRTALRRVISAWIETVLGSNRHHCSAVARAAERLADPELSDGVRRMLERDLADRAQARAAYFAGPRRGPMPADVIMSYTNEYRRAFAAMGGAQVIATLKGYLPNPGFGIEAAGALLDIWRKDHPAGERRLGVWNDFSMVMPRRAERGNPGTPPPTSEFAEAIFDAARPLADPATRAEEQLHAIALATIGLSMLHGSKRDDIDRLLALPQPFATKRSLVAAMARTGEIIPADTLMAGIRKLLEVARTDRWRLDENRGDLIGWIELFPFCDRPSAVTEAIDLLPAEHQQPWRLRRLLEAIPDGPPEEALEVLEQLATQRPEIMAQYEWLSALLKLGTEASAMELLNRLSDERVLQSASTNFRISEVLAGLARKFSSVRAELLQRCRSMERGRAKAVIESAVGELADEESVITLVEVYAAEGRGDNGHLSSALRALAIGQRPSEDWPGAYVEFSVPLTDLRRHLFAMMAAGGAVARLAEDCLNVIEEHRDALGRINNEPRHPDLAAGRQWPPAAESRDQPGEQARVAFGSRGKP
jgi:hypothetical protein